MIVIQQKINKYIYISECFSIWFVEVTHEQIPFKSACFLN